MQTWSGSDSEDSIEFHNGRIIRRFFTGWYEGLGYDLEIGETIVCWRIKSINSRKSLLSITIFPPELQDRPWIWGVIPYYFRMRPGHSKYLKSVLKGFEFYLSTGRSVSKNQFGSHEWFSAKD